MVESRGDSGKKSAEALWETEFLRIANASVPPSAQGWAAAQLINLLRVSLRAGSSQRFLQSYGAARYPR